MKRIAEERGLMAEFEELYRDAMAETAKETGIRRWQLSGRLAPAEREDPEEGRGGERTPPLPPRCK